MASNPEKGSALYAAGFSKGDEIVSIGEQPTDGKLSTGEFLSGMQPGQQVKVNYLRYGKHGTKDLTLGSDPAFKTELAEDLDAQTRKRLNEWLARGE